MLEDYRKKNMFENVGQQLKDYARRLFWIYLVSGIILGVILFIIGISESAVFSIIGLVVIALSYGFAWVNSVLIYGFGELIVKTTEVARNTRGGEVKSEAQNMKDDERIAKLEKLRAEGLITEEDYKQKVSEILKEKAQ